MAISSIDCVVRGGDGRDAQGSEMYFNERQGQGIGPGNRLRVIPWFK
jgi:hypothetical protein